MNKWYSKTTWWVLSGSTAAAAILLKKDVRNRVSSAVSTLSRKSSDWRDMLASSPENVINACRNAGEKYFLLTHTLSDEMKQLRSNSINTGEHVYKAYLSGIQAVNTLKEMKYKTTNILSGTKPFLAYDEKSQVQLEEAVQSMSIRPNS